MTFDSSGIPLFHSAPVFHELVCPISVVLPQIFTNLTTLFSYPVPQWGAADAEIEIPLLKTQSLKVLPLNPGVGQHIAMHATLTARDFFLANFYLSAHSPAFFQNFSLVFPVLPVANTGSCVGLQNKIGHPAGCRFSVLSVHGT